MEGGEEGREGGGGLDFEAVEVKCLIAETKKGLESASSQTRVEIYAMLADMIVANLQKGTLMVRRN